MTDEPRVEAAEETRSPDAALRAGFGAALVLLLVLLAVLVALLMPRGARYYPPIAGLRPLLMITGPGVGSKPLFDHPMGAAFGLNDRIYVADTGNNRIVVFDRSGTYLFQFGGLGVAKPAFGGTFSWKPGRMNYPTDVTTDERGNVYVADFGNDQIQVFSADGVPIRAFPDPDVQVGKGASGKNGTGIAVTSVAVVNNRVYATDAYQVCVFTTGGQFIGQFGKPGSGPADFDHPDGIGVTSDGTLVVSDSNHNRVLGMTALGNPRWMAGQIHPIDSSRPSEFDVPRGLTALQDGTILVADSLASHLVLLSHAGAFLASYGQPGSTAGSFMFPTDVAAGPDGRLVVTEKGNDRVQVVTLVR